MKDKPIPEGYYAEEFGVYQRLVRDADGAVIAIIEPAVFKRQIHNENFIMSMFEQHDDREAEAISTFYGNYWRRRNTYGQVKR